MDILFIAYYESFVRCNGERWRALCVLYKVHYFSSMLYLFLLPSFYKYSTILYMLTMQVVQGILSGSYNIQMLAISSAAIHSSCQVKVRLLFILMETLDLESLLQMVHDQKTFRFQSCLLKFIYFRINRWAINKDVFTFLLWTM